MRRYSTALAALAGCAVLTLGACSSGEAEPGVSPTAPRAEPTVESTPEPEPSPTETAPIGPADRSDEELGLRFDLPDVEGDARAALDVYTLFEALFWESLVDGELHADLADAAGPAVVDFVEVQVDNNREGGWTVGGENVVTVDEVQANVGTALVTSCVDGAGTTFAKDGGDPRPAAEFGMASFSVQAELNASGPTGWQVSRYETGEEC